MGAGSATLHNLGRGSSSDRFGQANDGSTQARKTTGTYDIMKIRLAHASTTAAVLVAAVIVYFMARTPRAELPRMAVVESLEADVELEGTAVLSGPKTRPRRPCDGAWSRRSLPAACLRPEERTCCA